jgi:hypothetical protein
MHHPRSLVRFDDIPHRGCIEDRLEVQVREHQVQSIERKGVGGVGTLGLVREAEESGVDETGFDQWREILDGIGRIVDNAPR